MPLLTLPILAPFYERDQPHDQVKFHIYGENTTVVVESNDTLYRLNMTDVRVLAGELLKHMSVNGFHGKTLTEPPYGYTICEPTIFASRNFDLVYYDETSQSWTKMTPESWNLYEKDFNSHGLVVAKRNGKV
jgi:hypothetical protein